MAITAAWSWLKTQFAPKLDPQLERWLNWYGGQVATILADRRANFDFLKACDELQIHPSLIAEVAFRTYRFYLRRAWADLSVSDGERVTLRQIGSLLGLRPEEMRELDLWTAEQAFGVTLSRAVEDGRLDTEERGRLATIARSVQLTLKALSNKYLGHNGRVFIEQIATCIDRDGTISDDEWRRIVSLATAIELTEDELLSALRPHGLNLLADVLARVTADSVLEEDEKRSIDSLMNRLKLGEVAREKITRATATLDIVRTVENPSITDLADCLNSCGPMEAVQLRVAPRNRATLLAVVRQARWWELTNTQFTNPKYHAGATTGVNRSRARAVRGLPRVLRTDAPCAGIEFSSGAAYFLENGVLTLGATGFRGAEYGQLKAERARFVEDEEVPPDSVVVDQTWEYVNKSGEADRRFLANRQLPVCEYVNVMVPGIGRIQASNPRLAEMLASH